MKKGGKEKTENSHAEKGIFPPFSLAFVHALVFWSFLNSGMHVSK